MAEGRRIRPIQILTALGIAALGVGFLWNAPAVSEGVGRGLTVCGNVLIPSLFPFMVLSVFLSGTEYGRILSRPLQLITTRVYKLPGDLGIVVLLGLTGGYPVGAKMIAGLLEEGRIDRATAERMLCFCVNSGPSFLITAVGLGMFHSREAGLILFGTQTAATLLIGFLVSLRAKPGELRLKPPVPTDNATALVLAVNSATSGMMAMCAFAILFSGLLYLVNSSGAVERLAACLPFAESTIRAAASGLLEVTTGCIAASQVGGLPGFAMTSCIVSFGGLSVLFQIMSCFRNAPIRFRPFLLSRAAHMGLSMAMALPLYRVLCKPVPVWLATAPPPLNATSKTALLSVCVLAMCAILTLQGKDAIPLKKRYSQFTPEA